MSRNRTGAFPFSPNPEVVRAPLGGQNRTLGSIERPLSQREFRRLVHPALGLPVSQSWLGYADVLFLELRKLHLEVSTLPKLGPRRFRVGHAGILFHSDWRAETSRRFLFGSRSSKTRMNAGLKDLKGRRVTAIDTDGGLPELVVELDRRIRVRGFSLGHGPDWDIRLDDPEILPRDTPWNRADHKVFVGYHDDRGLYRALCYAPKTMSVKP